MDDETNEPAEQQFDRQPMLDTLGEALRSCFERLRSTGCNPSGTVIFRSKSGAAADFSVRMMDDGVDVNAGEESPNGAVLEIVGDPDRICAVLTGEQDAREQFYRGGIQVRGDLGYLSRAGVQLGWFDHPIV